MKSGEVGRLGRGKGARKSNGREGKEWKGKAKGKDMERSEGKGRKEKEMGEKGKAREGREVKGKEGKEKRKEEKREGQGNTRNRRKGGMGTEGKRRQNEEKKKRTNLLTFEQCTFSFSFLEKVFVFRIRLTGSGNANTFGLLRRNLE